MKTSLDLTHARTARPIAASHKPETKTAVITRPFESAKNLMAFHKSAKQQLVAAALHHGGGERLLRSREQSQAGLGARWVHRNELGLASVRACCRTEPFRPTRPSAS